MSAEATTTPRLSEAAEACLALVRATCETSGFAPGSREAGDLCHRLIAASCAGLGFDLRAMIVDGTTPGEFRPEALLFPRAKATG